MFYVIQLSHFDDINFTSCLMEIKIRRQEPIVLNWVSVIDFTESFPECSKQARGL